MHGIPLSAATKECFLTSFFVMAQVGLEAEAMRLKSQLSRDELEYPLDLRSFYDPAPFAVNSLTPLSVVYRLFNEIGVRSVPVLSSDQCLVGIITRKDVLPDTISGRLSAAEVHDWANEMHRYWRGVLYGSASNIRPRSTDGPSNKEGEGDQRERLKRAPDKRRMSMATFAQRRSSNATETRRPSLTLLRLSAEGGQLARRISHALQASCTQPQVSLSGEGSCASRSSSKEGSSASSLGSSVRARRNHSSNVPGRHEQVRCTDGDDLQLAAALVARERMAISGAVCADEKQDLLRISKSLLLSPSALAPNEGDVVETCCCSRGGSRNPSTQPSLAASLRAAARKCRQGSSNDGSRSSTPLLVKANRNRTSSPSQRPPHGSSSNTYLQFASLRSIERRESAPAKLLSLQFSKLVPRLETPTAEPYQSSNAGT